MKHIKTFESWDPMGSWDPNHPSNRNEVTIDDIKKELTYRLGKIFDYEFGLDNRVDKLISINKVWLERVMKTDSKRN